MLPPALAVITGTLGGLFLGERELVRFDRGALVLLYTTLALLLVFLVSLRIFRRRPGHVHKRFGSPYISQSQLRYRYGLIVYYAGLVVLCCCAFWNGLFQYATIGPAPGRVKAGERNILCLRVKEFPVPVVTASGRHYERMECRLVIYSPDGRRQIQGNENMLVYVAVDNMRKGYRQDTMAAKPTGLLPGDVFMTRSRTFSFAGDSPAGASASAASSFDYPRYMARRGFYCRTYVYDYRRIQSELTLYERLRRLRVPLTAHWEGEAGAILSGICLGDKSGLGKDVRERFNVAGASHILAVSGLHVGALYGSLVFVLGLPGRIREERRYKRRRRITVSAVPEYGQIAAARSQILKTYSLSGGAWAHVVALLLIWSYAAVVGFSASVMRAALMLTIYGAGRVLGTRTHGLNVLSLAALILVIAKPMNLYDVGFQLSFIAVLSLMLFFPLFRNLLSVRNAIWKYLWELFCCSLSVQLGTTWLVAGTFGVIPLYGLLCNFFVVPFSAVILYGFLLYLVAMGVHAVAGLWGLPVLTLENVLKTVNLLLHYLAGILDKAVSLFSGLPYTPIRYRPDFIEQFLMLWCTGYLYFFLREREELKG
ncbi:MAG: ComEC/Rec2 family competence protein [Bacteroidales bacterium]|nr:ComEC/Rec2 family competence protein [Bacteroidales bacterium]